MPGDPSKGRERQTVGGALVPSRARNTARVCDPTRVGGGNDGAHTTHGTTAATRPCVRRRSSQAPVLLGQSTIRRSIGRNANRKSDSNTQGTLSTYPGRITSSGGGGERRRGRATRIDTKNGASGANERRRRQRCGRTSERAANERAANERTASERANAERRASERANGGERRSGGGRRYVPLRQ